MARKYQDGQYGQLVKKNQKNRKKKSGNIAQAMSQTASQVRKASKRAVSQGKGTPTYRNNTNSSQIQTSKYQDGQYGQFVKNSRLGQSGAAQRNNNQKQQEARRKQQKNNRAASTYGELNERANERNQQRAKQQSKSAHRFENATKGTLQQTLGSHATTFYAARNPNEDKYIQSEKHRKQQGEKNHGKFSEGQYGQLVKKERSGNVKEREKNLKKASELIDKGNKNIEKSKEGLGKGGRFAVDTYSAMLGMATDAAAGPFSMGSMASRSFGAAYDTAKKEGANDTQAALYGASQAAVETGTEKMFALAKPLKKLYGAGVGDDVAEKLLEKMTKKASTKAGKEVVYHGGKTAMAALSEGLEEMVSEGLEPALANQIYANATGTPHSTSAKDVLYAGAVGGAMGGILGGGGQAVEYNQGRKIQNVYGNDGLKTMAKKLRDVADEASGRAAVGELINRTIDEGQPVTSVQSRRLYQAAAQQEEADFKRQSVMNTVASNEITKKNYLNPVEIDQEGNMLVGETTRRRYDESVQNIVQQVKESGMDKGMEMPDSQVDQIASAVSAIKTGVAGTNEVNMFLVANPKARTVYETITGEKLPAGNTDTKETLYARIAANRVESAKLETEAFTDRVKGGMAQDVAKTYEPSGQAAFEQMMDQADIANAAQTQNDITAFDDYYRAGRNGIAYETVAQMNHPAHQAVKAEVRKAAWEAGASDAVLAADTAKGVQMEIGKKISQSRSNGKSGRHRGRVVSELSQETKRNLPASQQKMFRQLARVFNVNIHIVDEDGFNGKYEDGEVYLSVQGDRDLPYIFSHEITHHMQDFAPVEYNELKELVRQAWAEKGGIDEAVNDKIAQYAEKDVQLTYEDALDEIIADSTYEMIQDEGFAEQICSENGSLAQKILDAIKNVLSKLRQVLAEGDGFTPAQNAALLSQLDILKDAEKLWTDGLVKAAENRDAVGAKGSTKSRVIKLSAKKGKKDSIRTQIESNLKKINEMDAVADVKTEGYKGKSDKQIIDAVMLNYKKRGYGVDRKGFGFISLEEEFINRSLNYLNTEAEYAAFDVLPQVLKNGMELRDNEHKGRGYNTVTFAAPVVINGKPGIVGAVVAKTKGNRYKTHRILMPDGSQYIFENEKAEATTSGMTEEKINGEGPDITSAVGNSIPQTNKKDNEKFSLKDSDGRELSKAQREYFKDSKVRDEDGNLLVMYHGTPKGDFTVFRDGSYFTQNKRYADGYQNETAGRTDLDPKTYEVYLNITKPFDIRNDEEARNIYINDYIKGGNAVGINPYMSDAEYDKINAIDWTEGDDLKDFLIDEEYDYDGLVLDEGADGGYGEDVVYRGDSYVIFSPDQVKNVDNENPTSDSDIRYSLKNENISPDARIPYTVHKSYITVKKNDTAALKKLQDSVKGMKRGTYENKATGYKADIVRETVGKIINPSGKSKFNHWAKKYIDNLNAAAYLPELFENAVYVDTKGNQKSKKANQQIQGYHHFVAPIYMDGKEYRVRIVAREKQNSDTLYIVETEVMKIKNGSSVGRRSSSRFVSVPSDISIPELVDGVKIYDYNMQRNDVYTHQDVKYSLPDESSIMDYAADRETEFAEVPPVRDYERRARGTKQQTYNELRAQVDKLKADKKLTRGRVLDKKSVKEQINDMVVMLKSYGTVDGKKTDTDLVRQATDNITSIYRYIKESDYPGAVNQAYNAAQDMIDGLHLVDDSMFREYKELRDLMRTTKISISEEDAANIPDFKDWKKSQFGRLRIGSDGMSVDTFYQVLTEKYPELFDHSISHPADQLQAVADVRESMEPFDILLDSEERSDLIKQAAQDMIDIAATGKPWKSWADRKKETYDEQVKRLKQRQKEALRDAVNTQKERSEKKLQQERQKWKERQQKEAEKHKEKLAAEKEKHKSKEQKQKYNRERKEIKEKIGKTHKWLSDRLLKPTDDKHIPEDFRKQVASILVSLDMQTERSKDLELKYGVSKATMKLHALKARYEEIAKEDGTGIFAYDDTLVSDMDSLGNLVEGKSVDQLTNEELSGLHDILKSIQYQIGSYNKWMSGYRNSGIFETANKSINACRKRQEKIKNRGKKYADGKFYERTGLVGLDQSIDYAMMTPGDAFQYFGEGMNEAYGALRKGFNKHIENIQTIRNFFDEVFSPYFKKTRLRKRAKPGSEIEDWRNSSTVKEFKVSGGTIQLNTSQIMSLYCLSKRDQAMGHILNSGIVATRVDPVGRIGRKLGKGVSKAIGGKSSVQGSAITVTFDDVEMIKRSLSDGQVEICEKILQFMNETCSVWGNEVSMKLFDYNKFTEPNYFPIKSSDAYIDTKTDGTQQMQSVTSYGFTKGTVVNASNPIVVDDIFNVAADHMNQMSLYNAFAPAMHDFNKIYNYRVVGEGGKHEASVKAALKDAYGFRAGNYIDHFLKDVNNQASNSLDGLTKIVTASLANYKKSTIAANLRVALQQPTAVARAFIMIDPKYFLGGKNSQLPTDEKFFKNMKDMQEHCPIARWKSWGFSQVDMARGIDDIMMNNEWTRLDRFTMEIYGKLDDITWGQIWGAVRKETLDKHPDVKVNSEEFYRICSERASEIYDKTQVVDSVFHRSQIMRNTDTMSKMVSSFMAEPTRTYNMMRTEILTSIDMIKNGESGGQAKLTRAVTVFLFNAALCSVAAAVADAYRRRDPDWDDDDDGSDWSWFEYWQQNAWANFKDNANPLNMIPVLKDFVSYSDGWDAQNMAMQGWAQLFDSFNRLREGDDDTAFSDFTNALGMVTGIPVKNVKREGKMWFEILGIDVSAAEIDGEETANGEVLLNKAKAFFKKRKSKKDKKKSDDKDLEPVDYAERVADGKEAGKGLSGEEKEDEVWSAVTKNYTNYIKAGDTESLKKMRKAYEAVGGDMDRFDDAMLKKTKEYLKKNIGEGGDAKKLAKYREYLIKEYSYTEAKISNEIIAKSETAKKFQVSLCEADEDTAVNTLSQLIDAGVSYEDFVQLYENRYKAIKPGDYSTGEMVNPVSGQITSGFGYRSSPGGIGSTNHKGIDIAVPEGTDVAAADGGTITKVDYNGSRGVYVEVTHGNGRKTRYQHLSGYYVQKGDVVKKGQTIAASGNTGHSTGPHLHFEVLEGGTPVNPMNYLK